MYEYVKIKCFFMSMVKIITQSDIFIGKCILEVSELGFEVTGKCY